MQLALDASLPNVSAAERTGSELDDIDALVRTYRPRLLRFVAFSIGDADLAESITQDCFLKAYNGRANFRGDCSVNTWLTSIAVNLIRDQQRLQKFRFWRQARATAIDVTDAANFLPSHESSPESRVLVQEKADQVQAALVNLSPNQRSIFLMRFADEMDLSEIAALTKMPINTVKTHLHRALKSVRSQVGNSQAGNTQAGNSQAGNSQAGSAPSAPTANLQTSAKSQVAAQKISGGKP
jgi:RNA polymerase sigma-70 factor, ECF subfamily